MNFTEDWFSHNIPNFETCMSASPDRKMFLEIGAFEGRSTCWLLQNGLSEKGSIICIDPFSGSIEHGGIDFAAVEARFWSNTKEAQKAEQKVALMKMTSEQALVDMLGFKYDFDFIYVDGNHSAEMAYSDGTGAWKLLKKGGVILFDDYKYPHEPTGEGIDRFLKDHEGQYDLLLSNYQLAVKKK